MKGQQLIEAMTKESGLETALSFELALHAARDDGKEIQMAGISCEIYTLLIAQLAKSPGRFEIIGSKAYHDGVLLVPFISSARTTQRLPHMQYFMFFDRYMTLVYSV